MNADNEEKVQLETLREDIETESVFLFTLYRCLVHRFYFSFIGGVIPIANIWWGLKP